MSRKTVGVTLAIYLLVSLAFGLFYQLTKIPSYNGPHADAAFIGAVVGGAAFPFIGAGLIPVIVWAFMRFRAAKAGGPLVVWGILAVLFMGFSGAENLYERQEAITKTASNIASLTGGDYDAFVRSARQSCVDGQRKSQINRAGGVTDQQINAYCQCFATAMAKEVTADEVAYLYRNNNSPSESFRQKADRVTPTCSRVALGK
jgi:hypothetical protein